MCGIVGYIGKKQVLPILIEGLKRLEYRGYDSAGIAYYSNEQIILEKAVGRIAKLEEKVCYQDQAYMGIGHTRWATHGGVTIENSHPHQVGDITIVHNGILENYLELKEKLQKQGYTFYSDTDTEVACGYMDYLYQNSQSHDMIEVLAGCMEDFVGSYAIVAMVRDIPDKLFVMKKDSPLLIGLGEEETYVASDSSAFSDKADHYIALGDLEIGILTESKVEIRKNGQIITPVVSPVDDDDLSSGREGFDHYMLKEIYEQSGKVKQWNAKYLKAIMKFLDLSKYKRIHIVGCGTAYHAGLVGKYLIEEYGEIEVNVFIASEYQYQKLFIDQNTLVIAVSQSGETADTLSCVKRVSHYGVSTLGIVNVRNSSIARCVEEVIYTQAGQEVAVASTKAYVSQIYIFSLLAVRMGIAKGKLELSEIDRAYRGLEDKMERLIQRDYQTLAERLWQYDDIFYLGRNIDYVTMLEGSLKLKEISYIHSEAMQAGELKHGTISLMNEESLVVVMITNERLAKKTVSNIKEVRARGAKVVLLALENFSSVIGEDCYDEVVWIPKGSVYVQPILNVIPLQLLAYYVAKKRGCDIDKPRNLAKSVTVE